MKTSTCAPPGWAVAGTGSLAAEQMVAAFRALGHRPLWVASRSERRGAEFARDAGIPHATTDPGKAAGDPEVRFVYVASGLERRPHYIRAAIAAGKHVICDAPVAADSRTAAALAEACAAAGIVLMALQRPRAAAVHLAMQRLIGDGEIGDLRSVSLMRGGPPQPRALRWTEGASPLPDLYLDLAAEDIDLAHFLIGHPVGQTIAMARLQAAPPAAPPEVLHYTLRMGEVLFQAQESLATDDIESSLVATGSDGVLIASGTFNQRGPGTLLRRHGGRNEFLPIRERDPFLTALDHFLDAVAGRPSPGATGRDCVAALAALEAVRRAVRRQPGPAPTGRSRRQPETP